MGRAALEKVSSGPFNWDRKIERILEVYAEVIGREGRGRPVADRAILAENSA